LFSTEGAQRLIIAAGEIDQDAKNSLPEYERCLEVLQTSAENAKRDVTEA
jgi:hypothetical protein